MAGSAGLLTVILLGGLSIEPPESRLTLKPGYQATSFLPVREATQAAAADLKSVYAISNTTIVRVDRLTGAELARATAPDLRHLNSAVLHEGRVYCAHSNYPLQPEESDIRQYDPETNTLTLFHRFEQPPGSLTWCLPRDGVWWCCFARYGRENDQTVLIRYEADWKETGRWTFPKEVVEDWDGMSASGAVFDGATLLVSHHHFQVLYRLAIPDQPGTLRFIEALASPFPGQGIAVDPVGGGLVGIDRPTHRVLFAQPIASEANPESR